MHPKLSNKIIIILIVLIIGWLFIRVVRLLIPLVLIAVVIGWVWDIFDSKGRGNKYDKYDKY
jgi:hypothetical protein